MVVDDPRPRVPVVVRFRCDAFEAGTRRVAHLRVVVRTDILEEDLHVQLRHLVGELERGGIGAVFLDFVERVVVEHLAVPPVVFRGKVEVDARHAVVARAVHARLGARGLLVDEDEADVGAGKNLALHRRHRVVDAGQFDGFIFGGLHGHQPDAPVIINLTAEARAAVDAVGDILSRGGIARDADAAGEKGPRVGVTEVGEQVAVFQEELAFLRVEDLEAVEVRDLVIDFHLGEIGVGRQVEVEGGSDGDFCVPADFHLLLGRRSRFKVVVRLGRCVRDHRNVAAGMAEGLVEEQVAHRRHILHRVHPRYG